MLCCACCAMHAVLCMLCWACCAMHAELLVWSRVMLGSDNAVGAASECSGTRTCSMRACPCCRLLQGGTQSSCCMVRGATASVLQGCGRLNRTARSSYLQCTVPIQLCCSFTCIRAPVAAAPELPFCMESSGVWEASRGQCVEGFEGHGGYVSCEGCVGMSRAVAMCRVLFWLAVVLAVVMAVHMLVLAAFLFSRWPTPYLLHFPRPELLVLLIALAAIAQGAASKSQTTLHHPHSPPESTIS